MPLTSKLISLVVFLIVLEVAGADDPKDLTPWLDVPAAWSRTLQDGVVAVSPNDLLPGAQLFLLVEPARHSSESLADAYEQALRDLGPWRPVGNPVEQKFDTGWVFRLGVGVATLEGRNYTAQTAVGRHGDLRVRFWALADSDDTYKRYQNAIGVAISSAQDITHPPAKAGAPAPQPVRSVPARRVTPTADAGKLPSGFGKGISGVYVGIERGLSARAGVGSGPQQVFNQSTGRYELSNTGTATAPMTQISDFLEVDVFYPDGTYRRRLPIRGLNSDFKWEQTQQLPLWGTWTQEGDKIIVKRQPGRYEIGVSSTTIYTLKGDELISGRGQPWVKLPLHTAMKLDGTFARDDYRDADAPRLTLRADGTYQEHQKFLRMVGSPWHLVEPDADAMVGRATDAQIEQVMAASSGRYSFDNFTLTLRANDGRIWQINAYVPTGEQLPRPRRLVINGRVLLRD
jgi:hypothetical protein